MLSFCAKICFSSWLLGCWQSPLALQTEELAIGAGPTSLCYLTLPVIVSHSFPPKHVAFGGALLTWICTFAIQVPPLAVLCHLSPCLVFLPFKSALWLCPSPYPVPRVCPLSMPFGSALSPCPVPLPFSIAFSPCPVRLPLTLPFDSAHHFCPFTLPCTSALQVCPLTLSFSFALSPCPLPLPFGLALHLCPSLLPFSSALRLCSVPCHGCPAPEPLALPFCAQPA